MLGQKGLIPYMKKTDESSEFPWMFFILAFGITWLIWLPGILATGDLIELLAPFTVLFFLGTWGPFAASIILGLIWGCWHVPLFFIEATGQYHMSLTVFIIGAVGMSVIHTWVYNKMGNNLLAALRFLQRKFPQEPRKGSSGDWMFIIGSFIRSENHNK